MSKEIEEQNKQLDLKLKQSPLNGLVKYKERFELFRARWDIRRYTKSTWVWLTIILSISFIVTQIFTIQEESSLLPKYIPLLQLYVDADKTLTPTNYIYLVPALSAIVLLFGIIFSNRFYNKERDLSDTLLWVMLLSIFIMTTSLIRLINLY